MTRPTRRERSGNDHSDGDGDRGARRRSSLTGEARVIIPARRPTPMPGRCAYDGCDTDITASIEVDGLVYTTAPGSTLTYRVRDGAGVPVEPVSRTVTVLPCVEPCDAVQQRSRRRYRRGRRRAVALPRGLHRDERPKPGLGRRRDARWLRIPLPARPGTGRQRRIRMPTARPTSSFSKAVPRAIRVSAPDLFRKPRRIRSGGGGYTGPIPGKRWRTP